MFEIDCRIDSRLEAEGRRLLRGMPGAYEKAAERAINRTVDKTQTSWAKAMAEEYRITRKKASDNLKKSKASARLNQLYGSVRANFETLELVNFVAQKRVWSSYKKKPRVGATVQVKRRGFKGRVAGVFVEKGTSTGDLHAMWRYRTKGGVLSQDARILYGPRIQDMASSVRPAILPKLNRFLQKRLAHELRHLHRQGGLEK